MLILIKDKFESSKGRWLAVKLSDILEVVEPVAHDLEWIVHHPDGVILNDWASRFTIHDLDADPPSVLSWKDVTILAKEIKHLTDITLDGFEPRSRVERISKSPSALEPKMTICCFDASQWEISLNDSEIANALVSRFRDVTVID